MKNFAWCVAMSSITVHGVEKVDTLLAVPDQETARAQILTVAQACFTNYPDLTEFQKDYARTALIQLYADNRNNVLCEIQRGELEGVHKDQLRASVRNQIEKQVDSAIAEAKCEEWKDMLDAYYTKREEQEQSRPNYIPHVFLSTVMLYFFLNVLLGHNS